MADAAFADRQHGFLAYSGFKKSTQMKWITLLKELLADKRTQRIVKIQKKMGRVTAK